jgi:hypothetical protein
MVNIAPLWHSSARKEAMDLLKSLWSLLDDEGRDILSAAILAGPPEELLSKINIGERAHSRDRRIFDRIGVLKAAGDPPLTGALNDELARISAAYPEWTQVPDERAHFGIWMQSSWGPDTNYDVNTLGGLEDSTLIHVLHTENDRRDGLLDAWRQFAARDNEKVLALLDKMIEGSEQPRSDILRYAMWGLRDAAKSGSALKLLKILQKVPDDLFIQSEVSQPAAEILQSIAEAAKSSQIPSEFWPLFDRTLLAASDDQSNSMVPSANDWVSVAINHSMGNLAQALFATMFARGLKSGEGIPGDLEDRINLLISPAVATHRPARIIAASRLSYLYAVDATWVEQNFLPSFSWDNEKEALALWDGFGWIGQIDLQLWHVIKLNFLDIFTPERVEKLGASRRNLAQLLMLAGIEFGADELPRDRVRAAIRAMTPDMRQDSVEWITIYLEQQRNSTSAIEDLLQTTETDIDVAWRKRVGPWLRRVWPSDPALRSGGISERLAVAAIETNSEFSDAVLIIKPYLVHADGYYFLNRLASSRHPELHPEACLTLIDQLIGTQSPSWEVLDLRSILDRIVANEPAVVDDARYRRWDQILRLRQ